MCLFFKKLIGRYLRGGRLNKTQHDVLLERLSHEVRTLLTGIVGYAEFLETDSAGPMVGFTAKIIRESGQALARVNAAYFDLKCLKDRSLYINSSAFDFAGVVSKVVDLSRPAAFDSSVYLVFYSESEPDCVWVNSDQSKVLQVLNSIIFWILQVAVKHSIFSVRLLVENGRCVLSFEYTNASNSERGLELDFWTNSRYQYQLQAGPGIELALAKELIKLLGWNVGYRVGEDGVSTLFLMMNVSCNQNDANDA